MQKMTRFARAGRSFALAISTLFFTGSVCLAQSQQSKTSTPEGLSPIRDYIYKGWDTLTRSMEDCSTVVDPKLAENSVLYLPADVPVSAQVEEMQRRCHVQVKALPEKIVRPGQLDTSKLDPP